MPMQNSTFKSILLVGSHANLYHRSMIESSNIPINTLKYKRKDPFAVDEPNQFIFNDIPIDFNGKYSLSELSFALSIIISQDPRFKQCLVIGDPTELLYQAFCFAKNDQNPNLIRQEIQSQPYKSKDAYLFLYPSGMVAHNIRKEISSLVYLLKKYKMNTFLIRDKNQSNIQILQNMLKRGEKCFDLNILEVNGIEKIISDQTAFTS